MEETNKLTKVEEAMGLGNLVASEKDVVRTPLVDALRAYFGVNQTPEMRTA